MLWWMWKRALELMFAATPGTRLIVRDLTTELIPRRRLLKLKWALLLTKCVSSKILSYEMHLQGLAASTPVAEVCATAEEVAGTPL